MAKLEDIIRQLHLVLPKYTDYFSDKLGLTSITYVSGDTFNIETDAVHGLTTGDYVNLDNILVKNPVTTITDLGDNQVKLKTSIEHDLTENFNLLEEENHTETVYLFGFTGLSDGFYTLLTVPSDDEFVISSNSVPSVVGSLSENRLDGIQGRYQSTVIDTTHFTIEAPNSSFTLFVLSGNEEIVTKMRITGSGAPDNFIKYYTEQTDVTDLWAWVTNGETRTSFSRKIESDANQRVAKSDDLRFECINPFFVYVIAPNTNKYGARIVSDLMIDIRKYLCKSLCGVNFDSGFDCEQTRFLTTFSGDNFFDYVGSYYVHEFIFETVYNFNPLDGVDPIDTRAFRDFEINIKLPFDEYVETKKTIEGELP